MKASELKERVNLIRNAHRGMDRANPDHAANCEPCLLLIAIDTAVARHWDPVSGRSLCSHAHARKP